MSSAITNFNRFEAKFTFTNVSRMYLATVRLAMYMKHIPKHTIHHEWCLYASPQSVELRKEKIISANKTVYIDIGQVGKVDVCDIISKVRVIPKKKTVPAKFDDAVVGELSEPLTNNELLEQLRGDSKVYDIHLASMKITDKEFSETFLHDNVIVAKVDPGPLIFVVSNIAVKKTSFIEHPYVTKAIVDDSTLVVNTYGKHPSTVLIEALERITVIPDELTISEASAGAVYVDYKYKDWNALVSNLIRLGFNKVCPDGVIQINSLTSSYVLEVNFINGSAEIVKECINKGVSMFMV